MSFGLSQATDGWHCVGSPSLSQATDGWHCTPVALDLGLGYPIIKGCSAPQGSPEALAAVMVAMDAFVGVETGKGSRAKVRTAAEATASAQTMSARASCAETGKGSASKVTTGASKAAKTTTKIRG